MDYALSMDVSTDIISRMDALLRKPMFHYTSLGSLASILSSKKIRFKRLDLVNDPNDGMCDDFSASRTLVFATCWTDEPYESVAMWHQYASHKGVRIELPSKMFEANNWRVVTDYGPLSLASSLQSQDVIRISRKGRAGILIDDRKTGSQIDVKNFTYQTCDVYGPSRMEYDGVSFSILNNESNLIRLGSAKRPEWSSEREVRYRIFARNPFDVFKNSSRSIEGYVWIVDDFWQDCLGADKIIEDYLMSTQGFSCFPVVSEHVDVPLSKDSLSNIKLTLGPDTTPGEELIVNTLCKEFLGFLPPIRKTHLRYKRHDHG